MTTPVRITAVSYLNTLPFIYGIEQQVAVSVSASHNGVRAETGLLRAGETIDLALRIPALCAADAIQGVADIALVPVAAIPQIPGFSIDTVLTISEPHASEGPFAPRIITDFCIGAEGPVETVVLLSDTPLHDIHRIYLDSHSRTSVQLVRVLAQEHWHINPQWVEASECASMAADGKIQLQPSEAMVAIGDKVFSLKAAHDYAYCYDLAAEWQAMTDGLPFAFAAWVACTAAGWEYAPTLNEALAYGVNHIADSITRTVHRSRDFEFTNAYRYLTQSIKFRLDAPKRQAMRLFWEKIISPG